jgi:hypothetical protein
VTKRRPKPDELAESAGLLRDVLDYFPASEDKPREAVVRRRVEGAIAAAELAAGEPAPREASLSRPSDWGNATRRVWQT